MDLKHLSKEECDKILDVINKDDELRAEDQRVFDEIKTSLMQLKVHPKRADVKAEKLCDRCNRTFRVDKHSFCRQCQQKACKYCRISLDKDGSKWMCLLCIKQRRFDEMTGEWVLRFQKRKHMSDTDEYNTEGELQMSPIKKRPYDGIYGISPNEEIKKQLMRNTTRYKHQKVEESKPISLVMVASRKGDINGNEEENKDRESGHHVVNGYNVVAEVYNADDFSESTKIEAGYNKEYSSDKLSTSSGLGHDSLERGSLEMKFSGSEDEIRPCPVHTNDIKLPVETVQGYDIIKTPVAGRKVGTPQVGGTKRAVWDGGNEVNSSFEDIEEVDGVNPVVSGKMDNDFYGNYLAGDDYEFTSSLDISTHQSYIESYYGD